MITLLANWRLIAAAIVGALLCWPVASCSGGRAADARMAAKVEVASAKVQRASSKAELAAKLAEMARETNTRQEVAELRKVVDDAKDDGAVGDATASVLARLRAKRRD